MRYLWAFVYFAILANDVHSATSVSQYGITWFWNGDHTVGQFANGDYWVLGPVTIDSITPHFDGSNNGWEVDPIVAGPQGFETPCYGGSFDASLVPVLPYTTPPSGIVSIVKTTPYFGDSKNRPCIQTAAVLTVVTEIPPDNGAAVFRPPYVATDKPYFYVDSLRTDLLPEYESTGLVNTFMPSLSSIESGFRKLRLDHKGGQIGRGLRPRDAMDDYQPANTPGINGAALRFMMDHGTEDITPALIQYVQAGIDKVYAILDGQTWPDGGGHQPGHIIMSAFTATMLDMQTVKDTLSNASFFHATRFLAGVTVNGNALWGENNTESGYWDYAMGNGGNRAQKDPYGYIDGGTAGGDYQLVTSQAHKGEVLAAHMMPVLRQAWPADDLARATDYADRWVNIGTWAQPDPCAPIDAGGTYGVDYGPDPENPGSCIRDSDLEYYNDSTDFKCRDGSECGRYPQDHGTSKDGGQYKSDFVAAVWNAHRGASCYDGICEDGETCEFDCGTSGIRSGSRYDNGNGLVIRISNRLICADQPSTFIVWGRAKEQPPSLSIYNSRGGLVRTLRSAGRLSVWHGLNDQGRPVAPGIYCLQALYNGRITTFKITVLE